MKLLDRNLEVEDEVVHALWSQFQASPANQRMPPPIAVAFELFSFSYYII